MFLAADDKNEMMNIRTATWEEEERVRERWHLDNSVNYLIAPQGPNEDLK